MYEAFFGLSSRPFVAAPLAESYFPAESIEQARQTLARAVDRAEGPGLIIGPTGVGKTLLCRVLADQFAGVFQVAMLSSTRIITRKSLLQTILFELGLPYREMEEGELRLLLLDHLQPHADCPHGVLLIVDEAHTLSFRLLEEIRLITNLVRDGQPRVRLLMAGGPKLDERFTSPKLDSFNQRIAARCYLSPFHREETLQYVRSRLAAAGGKPDGVFTSDALHAVYQATDGIPRLINQVCDHALVMAFAGGRRQIDRAGIEEAWSDLQQLPGPWQASSKPAISGAAIEFGELDQQPTATYATIEGDREADWGEDTAHTVISWPSATSDGFEWPSEQAEFETQPPQQPHRLENAAPLSRNPFEGDFEEEEVVIDALAARELELFAGRPEVQSVEGRALARSLAQPGAPEHTQRKHSASAGQPTPRHAGPAGGNDASSLDPSSASTDADQARGEPAFLSHMFEYTVFEPNRVADLALEALCELNIAVDSLQAYDDESREPATVRLSDHHSEAIDDRDLIILEDEHSEVADLADEEFRDDSPRRVEYPQLFSQLRHS